MNAFYSGHRSLLLAGIWILFILVDVSVDVSNVGAQTGTSEEDPTGDFTGTVENLDILNVVDLRKTDVLISEVEFISVGHFSIPTIDFRETIGAGITNFPIPPSGPGQVAWWDVEIEVTRSASDVNGNRGVMISIDKDVTNNTNFHWTDFHMTVGRGVGPDFEESDEFDNLYFKTDPKPVLEVPNNDFVDAFENPPEMDEPVAPDNLWWFAGNKAGQAPGERTDYWLALNVPASAFSGPDRTRTTITLREHASIPEPSGIVLLMAGAAFVTIVGRRCPASLLLG